MKMANQLIKFRFNDLIIKAVAMSLKVPEAEILWSDDAIFSL